MTSEPESVPFPTDAKDIKKYRKQPQVLSKWLYEAVMDGSGKDKDLVQAIFEAYQKTDDTAGNMKSISDGVALRYGVADAVAQFSQHWLQSGRWAETTTDMTFSFRSMSDFDKDLPDLPISVALRAKILAEVANVANCKVEDITDVSPGDRKDADHANGIKITNPQAIELVKQELSKKNKDNGVDMDHVAHQGDAEQLKALSMWSGLPEAMIENGFKTFEKTWADSQKAVLKADSLDAMGQELCLQMFMFPFNMLQTFTAKMDTWVLDAAKKRAIVADALPDNPLPKTRPGKLFNFAKLAEDELPKLTEFKEEYILALQKDANEVESDDPARATELRQLAQDIDDYLWGGKKLAGKDFHTCDEATQAKIRDVSKAFEQNLHTTIVERYVSACNPDTPKTDAESRAVVLAGMIGKSQVLMPVAEYLDKAFAKEKEAKHLDYNVTYDHKTVTDFSIDRIKALAYDAATTDDTEESCTRITKPGKADHSFGTLVDRAKGNVIRFDASEEGITTVLFNEETQTMVVEKYNREGTRDSEFTPIHISLDGDKVMRTNPDGAKIEVSGSEAQQWKDSFARNKSLLESDRVGYLKEALAKQESADTSEMHMKLAKTLFERSA